MTSWGCLPAKVDPITESHHMLASFWKAPVIIRTWCSIGYVILPNTPIADEIYRKVFSASHFSKNGCPPFFIKCSYCQSPWFLASADLSKPSPSSNWKECLLAGALLTLVMPLPRVSILAWIGAIRRAVIGMVSWCSTGGGGGGGPIVKVGSPPPHHPLLASFPLGSLKGLSI